MNIYPYVYCLTHKITRQKYIGYRSANKAPAESDLGIVYFTSSNEITKENFHEFEKEIVAIFFEKADAYDFEQFLIHENWDNSLLMNKSCYYGKACFRLHSHTKESCEKISAARKGIIFTEEHRANLSSSQQNKNLDYVTDEYRASQAEKSRNISDDTRRKRSESHKGKVKSKEHLEAISAALSGRTLSEDHKSKLRGRKFTEEHKQKLREAKARRKEQKLLQSTS